MGKDPVDLAHDILKDLELSKIHKEDEAEASEAKEVPKVPEVDELEAEVAKAKENAEKVVPEVPEPAAMPAADSSASAPEFRMKEAPSDTDIASSIMAEVSLKDTSAADKVSLVEPAVKEEKKPGLFSKIIPAGLFKKKENADVSRIGEATAALTAETADLNEELVVPDLPDINLDAKAAAEEAIKDVEKEIDNEVMAQIDTMISEVEAPKTGKFRTEGLDAHDDHSFLVDNLPQSLMIDDNFVSDAVKELEDQLFKIDQEIDHIDAKLDNLSEKL